MSRTTKFSVELALDDAYLSVTVEGNATPYDPGVTSGPPERCYPPEGGEVEIENVWLEHPGNRDRPAMKLEISPLLLLLDAFEKLQEMTEQALADQAPDEPDYSDYED